MDARLIQLLRHVVLGPAPSSISTLIETASEHDVTLPGDYIELMRDHDGGEGDVGARWLQLWDIARVVSTAETTAAPYEGVLPFAGDGANTVYGFDAATAGDIVEGDWIGLGRDELISHGPTLATFLEGLENTT
jgi:hypothetical protein